MVEAFPFDTAPKCVLRDRDMIHGAKFCSRVQGMGIGEVPTALQLFSINSMADPHPVHPVCTAEQ